MINISIRFAGQGRRPAEVHGSDRYDNEYHLQSVCMLSEFFRSSCLFFWFVCFGAFQFGSWTCLLMDYVLGFIMYLLSFSNCKYVCLLLLYFMTILRILELKREIRV